MALLALALVMPSCNKGPGEGGTGTVQGTVMLVHHPDDNYTLASDTMVAAKTDVFIVYGDENYFGNDVETGADGGYQFEYLLPGEYTVYAYSILPSRRSPWRVAPWRRCLLFTSMTARPMAPPS